MLALFGRVQIAAGRGRCSGCPLGADGWRSCRSWPRRALQCLHAFSFGAAHLAAIYFLTHAVPEDRGATAQGIYAATIAGLALGLATIASGPLYHLLAGQAYAVMALLALVGAVSARLLEGRWRGELVVGAIVVQPQSSRDGGNTSPDL